MAKQQQDASINLDSFLDIMTCLVGVLVLILILTGIDAGQIKVLIPTPMEHESDKRQMYFECRDGELFLIPVRDLRDMTVRALDEIAVEAEGDMEEMLRLLHKKEVGNEAYRVDLSFALLGQFAVSLVEGTKGYRLMSLESERGTGWFWNILKDLDPETEMVSFLVRDDSFGVFKRARHVAWKWDIEVAYNLLDVDDVIKFGLGGSAPLAQ